MSSAQSHVFEGKRRHVVIGLSALIVLGVLYLIAAAVNGLAPFGSTSSPNGSSTATSSAGASAAQAPGTTQPSTNPQSLANLMPDEGCQPPPSSTTQGFAGLMSALQCTNDPNLPSAAIQGFQFDNGTDYAAGLKLLDQNIGFREAGAGSSCPPSASPSGSTPWQSSDYPGQTGQVLQCLTASGDPTYVWTVPSRLAFIEAVDTTPQDGYADLQNWFVNDAEP